MCESAAPKYGSENAGRVAARFVDTDYNGQTFCIRQAFFPNKSAWKKIERALKGTLDKDRFALLTGQQSLSFRPGQHKRVAVKVIDPCGNEVMKVIRLYNLWSSDLKSEFQTSAQT